MKVAVGQMVRVVDHGDYANIRRIGEVGKVSKIDEDTVSVMFDGMKESIEYPSELLMKLSEADQKDLKKGGKDGMPDSSQPTPPQMDAEKLDDLSGEQKEVKQANSPESHATGNDGQSAGVTSEPVKLNGEQKDVPQATGGTSSQTRPDAGAGSQSAGVKGENLELKGDQGQLKGVPAPEKVKGVKDGFRSDAGRAQMLEGQRVFNPIRISLLDEADGDDEYVTIGESNAIRNEAHLYASIRGAVKKALESMERPFDAVDIVFRRNPMSESKRRHAERSVMATLHMQAEGKAHSADVRKVAFEAARLGIKTSRLAEYTDDRYSKQILADAERRVQEEVEIIWPPKMLEGLVGQRLIVETIFGDRWIGNLKKGPGRNYTIEMATGKKKFSAKDVRAIYRNEQKK